MSASLRNSYTRVCSEKRVEPSKVVLSALNRPVDQVLHLSGSSLPREQVRLGFLPLLFFLGLL